MDRNVFVLIVQIKIKVRLPNLKILIKKVALVNQQNVISVIVIVFPKVYLADHSANAPNVKI